MAEFASKGVAGAGLGTGIAGLALGVLNSSNNGNGLLGGLLGGGNQNVVSALQAENSAFDKSGTVEYLGFKFDKSDGEALINIMEKYKDD